MAKAVKENKLINKTDLIWLLLFLFIIMKSYSIRKSYGKQQHPQRLSIRAFPQKEAWPLWGVERCSDLYKSYKFIFQRGGLAESYCSSFW